MSAKLVLYNAVKARLLAIKDDEEVPVSIVKTSGHWNNQFDRVNEEIQFVFPAVYIEFSSLDWKTDVGVDQKNHTQQARANCDITLHIGIENIKDETDSFPEDLAIIDSIYDQLNGYEDTSTNQFTPLKRTTETDDNNKNNIRHWTITFNTMLSEKGYEGSETDATDGGSTVIAIGLTTNYT